MDIPIIIKTKICIVALIVLGFSPLVYAQAVQKPESQRCSDDVLRDIGKLYNFDGLTYRNEQSKGLVLMTACRIWPYDESITLSAFLIGSSHAGGNPELYIGMVDNKKNQLLARYNEALGNPFAPVIDADKDHLRIDTARYDLAPGVRAFGIDVFKGDQDDPYCGAETIGHTRHLYVKRGNEIGELFSQGLTMSYRTRIKGNANCRDGKPTTTQGVVFEDIKLTITMSKNTSDGYADLIITGVSTYSDGTPSPRKPFYSEMKYSHHFIGNKDHGTYANSPNGDLNSLIRAWRSEVKSEESEAYN